MQEYENFSVQVAMDRAGGGIDRIIEIAEFFPSYVIELINPIEEAWNQKNFDDLEKSAHKIKGSLGMIGATHSFESAKRLEKMASKGDSSELSGAIEDLKNNVQSLLTDLKQFVKDNHVG